MRYCSISRTAASLMMGLALGLAGCSTPSAVGPEAEGHGVSPKTAKAEALLAKGNLAGAMIACVDLARENPDLPGLRDLQRRILVALEAQRAETAKARQADTERRMMTDVQSHDNIPDTYQVRRNVQGQTGSIRKPVTAMQKVLQKKVDASFDNINLADFIREAGLAYGLNMIADSTVGADKTMNLNFKQVPLSEVLDYVSRNLGVAFYLGDNVIWVTQQQQATQGPPMDMRMYHLRKGISPDSIPATAQAKSQGQGQAQPDAAAGGTQPLNIIEAIQRFVEQPTGADLMFDPKSHTLLIKNTAENLAKAEDIVEALDVCPPQILIEARFVDTRVTDLRELGVDWVINDSLQITKSGNLDQTAIAAGATLGHSPLTPSIFPNAADGLNLSYQGILTDPMFQAVLHALDTSGKSRTLSVPRVTTVNNRAADIRVGTDFRYYDEWSLQTVAQQASGANAVTTYVTQMVPTGSPKLEELGIDLTVTPSVGADLQSVTLNLRPEISSLDGFQTFQSGTGSGGNTSSSSGTNAPGLLSLPIFKRSKIETQVIVQSGETVVMGGLISSTEQHDRSGVPILSSIPFIGQLFRHDKITHDPDNLLIFVTATIISERGEDLIPLAPGPQALPAGATDIPAK